MTLTTPPTTPSTATLTKNPDGTFTCSTRPDLHIVEHVDHGWLSVFSERGGLLLDVQSHNTRMDLLIAAIEATPRFDAFTPNEDGNGVPYTQGEISGCIYPYAAPFTLTAMWGAHSASVPTRKVEPKDVGAYEVAILVGSWRLPHDMVDALFLAAGVAPPVRLALGSIAAGGITMRQGPVPRVDLLRFWRFIEDDPDRALLRLSGYIADQLSMTTPTKEQP